MQKNKKANLLLSIGVCILLALIVTLTGYFEDEDVNVNVNGNNSGVKVHFVDVGQGDCEIIQTQNCNIIIDAGEVTAKDAVLEYINSLNITRFDYVIATHPHSDHIGSLSSVIDNFEIGTVIMPKVQEKLVPTTSAYRRLLSSISDKGLKIHKAVFGETFDIDGAVLKILGPIKDYDDLNSYSVVCKFTYDERSFLFSGDAEKGAEADIINEFSGELSADVYKVGHHGSKTSSSKEFLAEISPEYAVISCGAGNDYGHPHKTTVKRLDAIKILRTDLLGSIVFVTDGRSLEYSAGE